MSTMGVKATDHRAICETVYRYATGIDTRDWTLYRSIFTDEIDIDFSSYSGRAGARMAADDWVANVRTQMTGLAATQHSMTNPVVTVDGDEAVCTMYMQAVHVLGGEASPDDWFDLGGYYTDRLVRHEDGWLLSGVTLTILWRRGRQEIMGRARQLGAERLGR